MTFMFANEVGGKMTCLIIIIIIGVCTYITRSRVKKNGKSCRINTYNYCSNTRNADVVYIIWLILLLMCFEKVVVRASLF